MEFNWLTFTLEILNFLVLMWILKRFLYEPVLRTIARRQAGIEQNLAEAAARSHAATMLEARYRDRLAEWEQQKKDLRAQAASEIDTQHARRMTALQHTLDNETARHRALAARQAEEQREQLERAAVEQGGRFAARLLERIAGLEVESRLVALALEDLAHLPVTRLQALRDACHAGAGPVLVSTGFALPAQDRSALLGTLTRALPGVPEAEFVEDPHLLAGLRIEIGPWLLQANLRDELAHFAEAARRDQ